MADGQASSIVLATQETGQISDVVQTNPAAAEEGAAASEELGRTADKKQFSNTSQDTREGLGLYGGRLMGTGKMNQGRRILFIILPLIVLASLSLWYLRNFYRVEFVQMTGVEPENGIYDLTGMDFSDGFVRLQGELTYIPGVVTPEEYAAREDEAIQARPQDMPAATSRMVIKVPDNDVYMMECSSIDYAYRAYVNGELRFQAGVPSDDAKDFVPGYSEMQLEVRPENGVIEFVQQGANFVHRTGGGHSGVYFGKPEIIRRFTALTVLTEAIKVGLFAALFFVHLLLFVVQGSYRANLYFSLLCLAWTVRNGLTGTKVFYALFPAIPWQAAYRVEHLTLPAAFILLILLARRVFPGIAQKWFVRASGVLAAAFAVVCLAADTVLLSWVQLYYNGIYAAAVIYLYIRFLMKLPGMARKGNLRTEQAISLAGFVLFLYAGVHDQLYHMDVPLPLDFAMTDAAMMIFSFFQMTAMFYGTMQEAALAHQRERQAETEKEMLAEMNRLKSSFYTDMSHEMKTPLTVIAVNAQFAAQNIRAGMVDEETVMDLNAISAEARRLAQMVTGLVGIGRMQGAKDGLLSLTSLLTGTSRIYQSLFARKNNTLAVEAPGDLPLVEGNADQLIQVLINLLSNANRHTAGGSVTIRAKALGNKVMVSVTDNGEGIQPSLLPHVFERFCHGETGGSGLGLPICRTIIEEHGGRIGIESEEGRGTRVWFTLPVKEGLGHEGDGDNPVGGG